MLIKNLQNHLTKYLHSAPTHVLKLTYQTYPVLLSTPAFIRHFDFFLSSMNACLIRCEQTLPILLHFHNILSFLSAAKRHWGIRQKKGDMESNVWSHFFVLFPKKNQQPYNTSSSAHTLRACRRSEDTDSKRSYKQTLDQFFKVIP